MIFTSKNLLISAVMFSWLIGSLFSPSNAVLDSSAWSCPRLFASIFSYNKTSTIERNSIIFKIYIHNIELSQWRCKVFETKFAKYELQVRANVCLNLVTTVTASAYKIDKVYYLWTGSNRCHPYTYIESLTTLTPSLRVGI